MTFEGIIINHNCQWITATFGIVCGISYAREYLVAPNKP